MPKLGSKLEKSPDNLLKKNISEEAMKEVLLLLENLIQREEDTIKLIVDYLYTVGSINLISQKYRSPIVQEILINISRTSKPAFSFFAWRWLKKNLPKKIYNFLSLKVAFQDVNTEETCVNIKTQNKTSNSHLMEEELECHQRELKHLLFQVKFLTLTLIGILISFF